MTQEIHAEALRLQENEALASILADIEAEAIAGLVDTPAEHTDRIRDHQAMARAVNQIRERVRLLVVTTKPKGKAALA